MFSVAALRFLIYPPAIIRVIPLIIVNAIYRTLAFRCFLVITALYCPFIEILEVMKPFIAYRNAPSSISFIGFI